MGITTNRFLNRVVITLGKISNGYLEKKLIGMLYALYAVFPPKHVKVAAVCYEQHQEEIEQVIKLLSDEKSKEIYRRMIAFRSTYRMKIHPGYSLIDIYFIKGIINLLDNEIFIDAGAYDGDTLNLFLKNTDGYQSIIAFEPDKDNFEKLESNYKNRKNVFLYNAGVWEKNTQLLFRADGSEISRIVDTEDTNITKIDVMAIDELEACSEATYIKMDIEGSELQALKGARKTIIKNSPKLAISIYHKDEDMFKIPLYIHSLLPEYKMYVRQHSHSFYDTVLYCIK